jgi:type VI secretion system protein ImpL
VRTEVGRAGPFRPISLSWPARTNTTLTFDPPASVGPLAFDGPWSALRLVMRRENTIQARPNQRERLALTIRAGDRSALFELRAGSSSHPFGLRELEDFRCPQLAP